MVRVGLDWSAFKDYIESDAAKQLVKDNTEELIQRGGKLY